MSDEKPTQPPCPDCDGKGTEPDGFQVTEKTCTRCEGTGVFRPARPTPSAYPRGTLVRGRTFEGGYLVEGFVCDECGHKDGYWWIDTVDPKASPANMRLVKPVEVLRTADWIAERLRMGQPSVDVYDALEYLRRARDRAKGERVRSIVASLIYDDVDAAIVALEHRTEQPKTSDPGPKFAHKGSENPDSLRRSGGASGAPAGPAGQERTDGGPRSGAPELLPPSGSLVELVLAFCAIQDAWLDALDDGMKLPADWAAAYKAMAYAAQDAERMGQDYYLANADAAERAGEVGAVRAAEDVSDAATQLETVLDAIGERTDHPKDFSAPATPPQAGCADPASPAIRGVTRDVATATAAHGPGRGDGGERPALHSSDGSPRATSGLAPFHERAEDALLDIETWDEDGGCAICLTRNGHGQVWCEEPEKNIACPVEDLRRALERRSANPKVVCELCGAIEPAPDATSDTGHVHLTCIYAVDRERTRAMRVDEAMRRRERMADAKGADWKARAEKAESTLRDVVTVVRAAYFGGEKGEADLAGLIKALIVLG